MMRIAWIFLLMAAVGVAVVLVRSGQNSARAEIFRLESERLKVRRRLWDQQFQLSGPLVERSRRDDLVDWAADLVAPGEAPPGERMVRRD